MSLGCFFCCSLQIFPTLSSAIATDIRLLTPSLPRYRFKLSYHLSLGPPFFACLPFLFATLFLAVCHRPFFAYALPTSFCFQILSFLGVLDSFIPSIYVALYFHLDQLFYVTCNSVFRLSISGAIVPNPYIQTGTVQASNTSFQVVTSVLCPT